MNIVEKLLDALNLEKMEQRRIAKAQSSVYSDNMALLPKIKVFWETHECSYYTPEDRRLSRDEIHEYALAYALSCFAKPQHSDKMSSFHLERTGITNWPAFFKDILRKNYIRPADAGEVLSTYTVKELKIIADSLGIKKSGKKMDLIDGIIFSATDDMIDNITANSDLYILTDKGADYISSREDYVLLERHSAFNVSLSEFNKHRILCGRRRNFYDTMFQTLSEKAFILQCHQNFSALAITKLHIFDIMLEEYSSTDHSVHIDVALSYYLEYLYLQLCFPEPSKRATEGIMLNGISAIQVPKLSARIIKFKDYFKSINYNVIFSNKPPCFLTDSEFIVLIDEFLNTPIFDYDKWNLLLQNRFSEYMRLFTRRTWRL